MALVFNTNGSDSNPLAFGGSPTAHARELTTGALLLGSFIGLMYVVGWVRLLAC